MKAITFSLNFPFLLKKGSAGVLFLLLLPLACTSTPKEKPATCATLMKKSRKDCTELLCTSDNLMNEELEKRCVSSVHQTGEMKKCMSEVLPVLEQLYNSKTGANLRCSKRPVK